MEMAKKPYSQTAPGNRYLAAALQFDNLQVERKNEAMLINLEREDDVFILTMDSGEYRWNTNFVRAFDARLDEVLGPKDRSR